MAIVVVENNRHSFIHTYVQGCRPFHAALVYILGLENFMARRNDAVACLKEGYTIWEIVSEFKISVSSVVQYLYTAVGEGQIRRSDILFSIPQEERNLIELLISSSEPVDNTSMVSEVLRKIKREKLPIKNDIVQIYLSLRDVRVQMGDMYEFISEIEKNLHSVIKQFLIEKYGPEENGWWRKGVPTPIRKTCAALREEDTEPADEPYFYTNFIHLQEILDKQWNLFSQILPINIIKDKKAF